MNQRLSERAREMRREIHAYIDARFQDKFKEPSPDETNYEKKLEKYEKRKEEYEPSNWLISRAKKASQIQVVTHPVKATHSAIKLREASNLYVEPKDVAASEYLTSAVLGAEFLRDVTGSAAALDVYDFVSQRFAENDVLSLCQRKDADLKAALHEDSEIAEDLMHDFASVTEPRTKSLQADTRLKQIYWLKDDELDPRLGSNFFLISPLYPSHLSHRIHTIIQEHRFGDEAKDARKARREGKPSEHEVFWYPELTSTVLGGAQPQNVSGLNSQRRGTTYLLGGLPPQWKSQDRRTYLSYDSVFKGFEKRRDTREIVQALSDFLTSEPPSNIHTRRRVGRYVSQLIDGLVAYVRPYQENSAPWSTDAKCTLPIEQRYWLNPLRGIEDDAFFEGWSLGEWPEAVGRTFGNWLNGALDRALPLGDVEHRFWRKEFNVDEDVWRDVIESQRKLRVTNKEVENDA